MCNITLNQPQGTISGGTVSSITITGNLDNCECDEVLVKIECVSEGVFATQTVIPNSAGNFSAIFNDPAVISELNCQCDRKITVTVECGDTIHSDTFNLDCEPTCCPSLDLSLIDVKDCVATFNLDVQIPSDCSPPVTFVVDFGDGNTFQDTATTSGIQVIQHTYNNASSQNFTVSVSLIWPQNCESSYIQETFTIPACELNCCPSLDLSLIDVRNCIATFHLDVQIPSDCSPPVTYEVDFGDGNTFQGTATTSGIQVIQHTYNNASSQNFTVSVSLTWPQNCESSHIQETFTIPACESNCCPSLDLSLINVKDCEATFHLDVQIPSDCSPPVTYEVDFGDGNTFQGTATTSGIQVIQHTYNNASSQNFTVSVSLTWPQNCESSHIQETFTIPACELNCCPSLALSLVGVKDCEATFNLDIQIPSNCSPPVTFEVDFGDGNTFQGTATTSGIQIIQHTYNNASSQNFTVSVSLIWPQDCESSHIQETFTIPACELNCCPDVSAEVTVKDCNDDCKREVEIITNFAPPTANCPYASMQWEYYDGNNNFIQYGQSFNNLMTSPHIDTVFLSSSQSPVSAILKTANPPLDCPDIVKTFDIPDCGGCPSITSFTHSIKGCVERAGKCCRKVEFEIKGTFCGNPRIRIEYGDGNYDEQIVQNSGQQTIIFDNEYCSGGNYNVKLKVITPSGCPDQNLAIKVPACDPKECDSIVDPEPPSPFCPCCILLLLLILSYFIGWALGWYQGSFTILGVEIGTFGIASVLYGFLTWLIINFCYRRNKDCRKCWECRVYKCAFYSLVIAAIIILILFIISLVTPLVVPLWWQSMSSAIAAALIFLALMNSQRCKNFFDTGDCN